MNEPNPYELDKAWKAAVEQGDPKAKEMDARFQETAELFERQLMELRAYARENLFPKL